MIVAIEQELDIASINKAFAEKCVIGHQRLPRQCGRDSEI
jgi:hypothetical protein